MDEQRTVTALIDRIVCGAHIPSRAEREDLRRELWTHFEDAGTSAEALREAVRRFGPETLLTESLRRVYRWDYLFLHLARVAASIVISVGAALVIQVVVNVRVELEAEVWRLAPGFSNAAVLSVAVVLGVVTAWEVGRKPFDRWRAAIAIGAYAAVCVVVELLFENGLGVFGRATFLVILGYLSSRLESRPAKLLITFGVFAVALYTTHLMVSVAFGPSRALLTSAVLVAVWASTVVILARLDLAFVNLFDIPQKGAV